MRLEVVRSGCWQVLAVCTERGQCPLLEFLDGLEGSLAGDSRRMLALLARVADQGPSRNVEVSHQVGGALWELIQGRLRVLWFYDVGRVVVCSHGFVKRTQKTPARELDLARASRARYLRARERRLIEIAWR
jgi:phage-related protein